MGSKAKKAKAVKEEEHQEEVKAEEQQEEVEAEERQEEVEATDPSKDEDANEEEGKPEEIMEEDEPNHPSSHPSIEGASPGKIFIGGLPKETTPSTFTKHFGEYGEITDSVIMKDRRTGHPRGFGFMTYADASVVDKVIQDTHVIHGKQVEIKRTIPKGAISGKDFKTKKIFVGGIPTTVTDDEFKNFFAKFGEVKEHQIMRDHSNSRSRGFGFISFHTEQAVDDLLAKGNRIEFAGAQVEIKKAEPKKSSNPAALPAKHFSDPNPAFGGGFGDAYSGHRGGGFSAGPYRSGGGFGSRLGAYGGYGEREFDIGYGGYGPAGLGSYRGESSLGYSDRYGAFGRGYDAGGYSGASEVYGGYGGYGSGYGSGVGAGYGGSGGYGGVGLYGSRGGYGGNDSGRYHPYAR